MGLIFGDKHKIIGVAGQPFECDQRRFLAIQPPHDRDRTPSHDRATGLDRGMQRRRGIGLDHHNPGAVTPEHARHRRRRSGQPAYARVQKDVCGGLVQLIARLGHQLQKPLHHPVGAFGIAGPGCVGQQLPAVRPCRRNRRRQAGLVNNARAHHLGRLGPQSRGKGLGHGFGQVDHRARAKDPRPGGNRQPVVARRGGDVSHARQSPGLRIAGNHIGSTQCLETAQPHARAFVLDPERAQPKPRRPRQIGRVAHRGRCMIGAVRQQVGDSPRVG